MVRVDDLRNGLTKGARLVTRDITYLWQYPICLVRRRRLVKDLIELVCSQLARTHFKKIVVFPHHAGDTFLGLGLIAANMDADDVVVVLKDRYAGLLRYFPTLRRFVALEEDSQLLREWSEEFVLSYKLGLSLPTGHRFKFGDVEVVVAAISLHTFLDYASNNESAHLACYFSRLLGVPCKLSRPKPEVRTIEAASQLAQSLGVEAGRSVLISPYASECNMIQSRLEGFRLLAERLKAKGYRVYTNIGPEDSPIPGTIPARIPLELLLPVANIIGNVVSYRSGVSDIVASGFEGKRMVVVYPGIDVHPRVPFLSYMSYVSVNRVFDRADIVELTFQGNAEEIATIADLF